MNLMLYEEWIHSPTRADGRQSLLTHVGISEIEERKLTHELFDFLTHLTKKLRLDNMALATAMFFIHRFFKVYSMKNPNRNPRLLGVAAVMLSAKIRYCPIVLKKAIEAFFVVEQ